MSRIILIDPDAIGRELLAGRLRGQGFIVETAGDGARGAELALSSPPSALIADLWMPGVSGVQLCRLLRAEPATADVPIVLRAEHDDPKNRFWTERAGAVALVSKGRMGELVRVLRRSATATPDDDAFFLQLGGGSVDVRDRIAAHLDAALFESVVAAEVRSLGTSCSFDGVFDSLSQLLSQLTTYHWLALSTGTSRVAVHAHPASIHLAEVSAQRALGVPEGMEVRHLQDNDAAPYGEEAPFHVTTRDVSFGGQTIARIAMATGAASDDVAKLLALVARELGGPIRLATLVEDSQRLAATDALTGLANRRSFLRSMQDEGERCDRGGLTLSVLLLDVDHFKQINDRFGHASGDAVLAALGALLPKQCRTYDTVARWGGEEFVVALPGTSIDQAAEVAERIRDAVERAIVCGVKGDRLPLSVSVGVASRDAGESSDAVLDRADCAMYAAKTSGRNRVCAASEPKQADDAGTALHLLSA
jgi:two-component system cell cycle response regulator